jgi:hypothetical protein
MTDETFSDTPEKMDSEALQRLHDLRVQETKSVLAALIEAHDVPGYHGAVTLALLELGIERHLERFPDEKYVGKLIEGILRKRLKRQQGSS